MKHTPNKHARIIKLWSIDVWDGGGGHNHAFYVESEAAAKEYLIGNTFDSYHMVELVVYSTGSDARRGDEEIQRQEALAKLTPTERKLLGLDE